MAASIQREDTHLYQQLGIDPAKVDVLALTPSQIASAYRRAALRWHPDKNPNDASAAANFSKVFIAYDTLFNPEKRKLVDDNIAAARASRQRFLQLDHTRQHMRAQLERRERDATRPAHQPPRPSVPTSTRVQMDDEVAIRMQKEIERLRAETNATSNDVRSASAPSPSSSQFASTLAQPPHPKDMEKRQAAFEAGAWAAVPSYSAFRSSATHNMSFIQFEQAILAGKDPFSTETS